MPRRRGPAPEPGSPGDSRYGGTGAWVDIPDVPRTGEIPAVPAWISETLRHPSTLPAYEALVRLPQASAWGAGDLLVVWLALPLLDKYFRQPGSEGFKALLSGLGSGPGVTPNDLLRLRRQLVPPSDEAEDDAPPPRRRRLVAVDLLPTAED